MSEQRKAVIKNADMSEEMQQDAVDIASQALAKYNIEKVSLVVRSTILLVSAFVNKGLGRGGGAFSIRQRKKRGCDSPEVLCELEKFTRIPNNIHNYLSPRCSPFLCFSFDRQDVAAYIKKEFDKKHNPTW
jgi:hypothetical protein